MSNQMDPIEQILAERGILRTLHSYCHALDYGLLDEWLNVFTEDGIFEFIRMPQGTVSRRLEGSQQLADYLTGYQGPAYRKHIVVDAVVEVGDQVAKSKSYFLHLVRGSDDRPRLRLFGRYLDRLVYVDGTWRIAERRVEIETEPTPFI